MSQEIETFKLFGGRVKTLSTTLGINSNPTVVTVTIVEDGSSISISNRSIIDIKIGAFDFRGIVQSWSKTEVDVAGTGIFQVRITDTKNVLNAAQVILGSSFDDDNVSARDLGDNIISIVPENASEILTGIPFNSIKTSVEKAKIKLGKETYTVKFNFTLPTRGSTVEYALKGRVSSLLELISQIGNDHGLDWFVTTSKSNVISINMYGRTNITDVTVDQLAALHTGEIIRREEGQENRDAIQKVVLLGGFRSFLNETAGSLWEQFWGLDDNGVPRSEPVFSREIMETVVNNDFTAEDFTEQDVQKIIAFSNEFWGRKFFGIIASSSSTVIGSDGKSWVVPASAAWSTSNSIPMNFTKDGQLKFQTDDGRWTTFATTPLPGQRIIKPGFPRTFEWEDELFSNPNSHLNDNGDISIKASLEIIRVNDRDKFFVLTLAAPLRVKILDPITETVTKTRLETIKSAFIALLDQRNTYGPWSNRRNSVGRTEVIIDASLTPWSFGFRGITNDEGIDLLDQVARAKIKTVIDDTPVDAKTAELAVADVPAVNIGDQLQTTGVVTSIQIIFGINGVRTIYKSLQFTNELSKHVRQQQDLLDKLRRQAAEFNNTRQFAQDDFELDRLTRVIKKELPEPSVDLRTEGNRRELKTSLGRIKARIDGLEPLYDITPMALVSDVFGSLTLERDPKVFGDFLRVLNLGEKPTAPGRLTVGTDVEVEEFSVTDGGIISRFINVPGPVPQSFNATIIQQISTGQPTYSVSPIFNAIQQVNLLPSELAALNEVLNIGEPANFKGFLAVGTEVLINWNENNNGSFTPFMEQQLNLFKPL